MSHPISEWLDELLAARHAPPPRRTLTQITLMAFAGIMSIAALATAVVAMGIGLRVIIIWLFSL